MDCPANPGWVPIDAIGPHMLAMRSELSELSAMDQIKSNQIKSNRIESNRIESNQIKSNQIRSNQIKSNQIKSNQIKSNQIKSNQIKSNQISRGSWPGGFSNRQNLQFLYSTPLSSTVAVAAATTVTRTLKENYNGTTTMMLPSHLEPLYIMVVGDRGGGIPHLPAQLY